ARGGGSAARVGDWDVELGPGWDWRSIPQLLSSACIFICSGGCFGCCEKAAKHVGDLSKSLIAHAQNPTVAEEFWSTTTIEVDPADLRAPYNTSSWDLDLHGVGSSHNLGESANHGFSLWQQTRDEWTENTRLRQEPVVKQIQEPVLRVGMQRMKVCLDQINHSLSPSLYMRWLISSWTSGSKRGCMTSTDVFVENNIAVVLMW
uniref:Gag1-like clamp domain-containing protein n=1 Tax=Aegilops tauschii subsp. strangulata TaxID=200361 RepID=A0A453EBH4_AEGTS